MSDVTVAALRCPGCGAGHERPLFTSLNGVLLPDEVEAIARGRFEQTACGCGATWQPEHPMLLSHLPMGEWLVMQPWAEHARYPTHEAEVLRVFGHHFAAPPAAVAGQVEAVRPRLVFGQAMLAEAVRVVGLRLDPAALECAKLLWARRNVSTLLGFGPALLCLEAPTFAGFAFSVRALDDGRVVGEVELSRDAIAEPLAQPAAWAEVAPRLFDRPYVSAARYLYPVGG